MPLPLVMHILFIVTFHSPLLTALSQHEATPGSSGPAPRPPLHLTRVLGDPRGPPGPSAGTLGRAMRHPGRFPEGGSRSFPLQRGRTFSSCPSSSPAEGRPRRCRPHPPSLLPPFQPRSPPLPVPFPAPRQPPRSPPLRPGCGGSARPGPARYRPPALWGRVGQGRGSPCPSSFFGSHPGL